MSEWEENVHGQYQGLVFCEYAEGEQLTGTAGKAEGAYWWLLLDHARIAEGTCASGDEAMQACDVAAFAWVLIALARKAAAWVDSIDAQLAREYRTAAAEYDRLKRGGRGFNADAAKDAAERALLRGWP